MSITHIDKPTNSIHNTPQNGSADYSISSTKLGDIFEVIEKIETIPSLQVLDLAMRINAFQSPPKELLAFAPYLDLARDPIALVSNRKPQLISDHKAEEMEYDTSNTHDERNLDER